MTPVAWALFNPRTGKIDHRAYQQEETARAGTARQSGRWSTWVAVPLFLVPEPTEPNEGRSTETNSSGVLVATEYDGSRWVQEDDYLAAQGRADDLRDALHDLVMLKAQDDIGCVPAPTREQWAKAWAAADELVRVEP